MGRCELYKTFFKNWFESQTVGATVEKMQDSPNCLMHGSQDGWKMKICYDGGKVVKEISPAVYKTANIDGKKYTVGVNNECNISLFDERWEQILPKFANMPFNDGEIKGRVEDLAELRILKGIMSPLVEGFKIMLPRCEWVIPIIDKKIVDGCYDLEIDDFGKGVFL